MNNKETNKLSINLTADNRRTLDKIKDEWGWNFGYTINYLINDINKYNFDIYITHAQTT